ncbi:MAG: AAA family ATPase [Candidatus Saccharibacteria bacterium]|nr:AAA family ATPase [Candidatus Saccharibacteria bacterium]
MNQQPNPFFNQPSAPQPIDPVMAQPTMQPVVQSAPMQPVQPAMPSADPAQPQPPASTQPATQPPQPTAPAQPATNFRNPTGAIPESDLANVGNIVDTITKAFSSRVVGQDNLRTALLVSMITGGHVLLESVPGLAKTTAVQTMAASVQGSFKRIQCTPDLLPSDIIGTQIYDYAKGEFRTELGPVHANFVLLDEINRSSAKTQSAMLEAMQERQTSIGGQRYDLPKPFIVLATQNPVEQEGTYELPEAQLDRFLLKEILQYPTPEEELEILKRIESGILGATPKADDLPTVSLDDITMMQQLVDKVYIDDAAKQYIVQIIAATRAPQQYIPAETARYVQYGASPRASITFQQVAKALALINGRDYVIPEDVKQLRHSVLRHRLILNFEAIADQVHPEVIIDAIFNAVTAP